MKLRKVGKLMLSAGIAAALAFSVSTAFAYKVVVDPGHGGSDPGATGGGLEEADIALDMGLKVKSWLNKDTQDSSGGGYWTVYMTRSTDTYVSLSGRTSYANNVGADRFMSIHNNAFNGTAKGIETFCYYSGSSNSFDLRNKVYEEATAMWPLTKRGTKTAGFYVIKYTNMPAELHEAAFIDNYTDRQYLASSSHRDNFARSQMYAIQRHMGYAKYTPSTAVVVTIDNTSSRFTPGSGWWASSSTPGYYGSNYHVRATAAASDAATWTASLPSSGNYKIEAWWTAGSNRAASAPYLVYHSGGTSTVRVNQQANGGKWNNLGTYYFGAGNREVKLSCWTTAGYYVIGDAVRFTKQ